LCTLLAFPSRSRPLATPGAQTTGWDCRAYFPVNRIVVVGPPGSGKTTVARAISRSLWLPHTELDSLWWGPNWTEAGAEAFGERVRVIVERDRWVVDGNYFSVGGRDLIWPLADTVVWLDLARWVTVSRVVRRTVSRGIQRSELWSGNRESIRLALRPDSIVRYAWRAHPKNNIRYADLSDDPNFAHLTWVRLSSPKAARRWIRALSPSRTAP
jgi:adenylate kinase family enzyme